MQFTLNVHYNSSWCLFSSDVEHLANEESEEPEDEEGEEGTSARELKAYKPYRFSGKNFTFEAQEKRIVDRKRAWVKDYFSNNLVIFPD